MEQLDQNFESPEGLIDQARDHTDRLAMEIKSFFENKPYTRVVDYDSETRQNVHKIRLTAKLPSKLGRIFKDSTSNLRDALDHAVYASAVSLGVDKPKNTAFPFANDATHLKGQLDRWMLEDVPADIHPILCSFQPYPGGNDKLVALNRIRNPNTHRIIVPIGTVTTPRSFNLDAKTINIDEGNLEVGYSRWDPAKNEVEFLRVPRGSQFKLDAQIAFDVALGDVEIVSGKPVLRFLREATTEVESTVARLKADTSRILRDRNQ